MSNIEKIRQEIERQIRSINEKQDANPAMPKYRWHMYEGMKEAFIDMNYFLDSLPEEGFATVNLADGDYDDGLRVHESTKSVHVSYRDVKDLSQRLEVVDTLPDENNPEPYNPVYDEDYLNEKIAKATKSWEGVDVDAMLAECRGYEEKPSDDLEEAARLYAIPHYMKDIDVNHIEEYPYDSGLEAAVIFGAKWQKQRDAELIEIAYKDGITIGKTKQKEQMMKDAVEGEIQMRYSGCLCAKTIRAINEDKFKLGDKVKIIILKDGE